ncbi:MAG TPA: hypothetical protein VIF09_19520 [Polyangiaceae bacterium]
MTAADPLGRALAEAVSGRRQALDDLLMRGSRLPGVRMNDDLAEAFAQACRTLGAKADPVAVAMAALSPDQAPGATAREFLPVCGVLALGARAAADAGVRPSHLEHLHAHADDLRFRVRDAVVHALARTGGAAGEALVGEVAPWMDGYFHAAAVVRALAVDTWATALKDPTGVVARLDEAFRLALDAPRAAARWPGHKALLAALTDCVPVVAVRFGVPVFDAVAAWASTKDPVMREVVASITRSKRFAGRLAGEAARVERALAATKAPPRNPDHDFGPSRDRSKARRRGRR